jgi:O-antigen ligase
MTRESFAKTLKTGAMASLLVVFLFADAVWGSAPGFIGPILREITAVVCDPATQWMVFLCLGIYFASFLFLRNCAISGFWQAGNPNMWLSCVMFVNAVVYAFYCSPSTQALTLLAGAVLGQGAAVWTGFEDRKQKTENRDGVWILIICVLMILLASASVWRTDRSQTFEYHGRIRWSGPWDNPNIAGMLVGAGAALAAGMAVRRWQMADGRLEIGDRRWKLEVRKYAVVILFLFAAGLMARGLLHSYSRGAWLATFCGLVWIAVQMIKDSRFQQIRTVRWIRINIVNLVIIICAIAVLSFWRFQQPQHPVARRAFSVGNVNDFSWRNRLSAWEGALQITAEHPWFGFGWNQPEPLYEHYYLPPKLGERAAFELNDYLMLGATLGIPALFCFIVYIWLSLVRGAERGVQNTQDGERGTQNVELAGRSEILPPVTRHLSPQTICRAGAIILLVGFWFDGGLFKLATASTFWILLELGSVELHKGAAKQTNEVS